MPPSISRQRGVAVVTALLLTTLAITIVASLFWQQQVQVRSIENQRLQLQKQWILRGALDWTRLILREDYRTGGAVDHLGEPWAVTLADTRLDQYVENGNTSDVPDAVLSGGIIDAQSRFNLKNICVNGNINKAQVEAFGRLLTNLQFDASLAQATATLMAQAQQTQTQAQGDAGQKGTSPQPAAASSQSSKPMDIKYVDDLLAVPGFTPEMLAKLKDFVVVLPEPTAVNMNTAPAEVVAASIDKLPLADAATLVASRERAYFRSRADFMQQPVLQGKNVPTDGIDFKTGYFLVNGNVRLSRASMEMQALIERKQLNTRVVWIRES